MRILFLILGLVFGSVAFAAEKSVEAAEFAGELELAQQGDAVGQYNLALSFLKPAPLAYKAPKLL